MAAVRDLRELVQRTQQTGESSSSLRNRNLNGTASAGVRSTAGSDLAFLGDLTGSSRSRKDELEIVPGLLTPSRDASMGQSTRGQIRQTKPTAPPQCLETLNSHLSASDGLALDFENPKGRVKMSATRQMEEYDCECDLA